MTPTPFGDQLKREREMRGVSLEEVSKATRISTRFLEALEKEQWDELPGGVFRRGFIRQVARFLGLDGDALVAEYELQTRDGPPEHVPGKHSSEIPRDYRPAIVAFGLIVALLAAGWFAFAHYGSVIAARLHHLQKAAPVTANSLAHPASPADPALTNSPGSAVAPGPAVLLALKIQAGKSSGLRVTADGRQVFDGHIAADEVKGFEAHDTLEIAAADPSALFLSLNGETVPPFGTPGKPGSLTLTHKDLKPQSGGDH